MTIANGSSTSDGGGIEIVNSGANVTLDDAILRDNSTTGDGGGIAIDGVSFLTVRNSTISGNTAGDGGGGIYFFSGGSLLMDTTTVTGNTATADTGGGIYFFGTVSAAPPPGFTANALVIRNSTIDHNNAGLNGGGIVLNSFIGTLLLQNSTVSTNDAVSSGGGIAQGSGSGSMTVQDSTITANSAHGTIAGTGGGGIARLSTLAGNINVQNSIVSGNSNANAPDIFRATVATTVNVNFSAVGSNTGFAFSGTSGNNLGPGTNLLLGGLAFNGGPTRTHALNAGSPALNVGSNGLIPAGFPNDQRGVGFARISSATVDIGAFERDVTPPTVNNPTFQFTVFPQSLQYVFSEDVGASLNPADLVLQNLTTSTTVPTANIAVSFNSGTKTATFTFPGFPFGALPDGNYKATLLGAGVTDPSGNPLSADNISFFFFLNGDANRDSHVNLLDFNIMAGNFNTSGKNFTQGDFNYDGNVNLLDFNILAGGSTRF